MKNLKSCIVAGFMAVLFGGGVVSTSASCILPDKCINFLKKGKRWEVSLHAKRTNPVSEVEQSVLVSWGKCYDDAAHDLLTEADDDNVAYQALRNDLLQAAQEACAEMYDGDTEGDVEGEWTNVKCDPFNTEDNLTWLLAETPNISCTLKEVYESNCPQPENASGTTSEMTTTEPPPTTTSPPTTTEAEPTTTVVEPTTTEGFGCASLELANWITCSGSTCLVSQDLIDAFAAEPTLVFCDSARLYPKIESSEVIGMYLDDVRPAGLAGMLGFLDDDVILAVDGLPLTNEEEFAVVAAEIANADTITVTIQRSSNRIELDFERD